MYYGYVFIECPNQANWGLCGLNVDVKGIRLLF